MLQKNVFRVSYSTVLYIIAPVFIHFLIIPFVFLVLTNLFYGGRYDLFKILTYTLANDLYILIIVYTAFVLGYKNLFRHASAKISAEGNPYSEIFVINNGKENIIVRIPEVVQILAATPYVEVKLEYLHTATLRAMSKILDDKDFIRVHKSAIVNRNGTQNENYWHCLSGKREDSRQDVILYIYHTSREGIYQTMGDEKGWTRRHGFIRGWAKTDKTGRYTFYTFRPGSYPDRSEHEHIHLTIKEPGKNEYYLDDFVFEDDPLLGKSERINFRNRGGSGLMKPVSREGILHIKRDIVLGLNIPGY